MKHRKDNKVLKEEESTENNRFSPVVSKTVSRISDLNQSKYLSPCRKVGLTRKRKMSLINPNTQNKTIERNVDNNGDEKHKNEIEACITRSNVKITNETVGQNENDNENQIRKLQRKRSNKGGNTRGHITKAISNNSLSHEPKVEGCVIENGVIEVQEGTDNKRSIEPSNRDAKLQCTKSVMNNDKNSTLTESIYKNNSKFALQPEISLTDCLNDTFTAKLCENKENRIYIPEEEILNKIGKVIESENIGAEPKLTNTCIKVINKRLNKKRITQKLKEENDSDPDFEDLPLSKVAKLENPKKCKSISDMKMTNSSNKVSVLHLSKLQKNSKKSKNDPYAVKRSDSNASQSSLLNSDVDDDNDFITKKTILERKSYHKSETSDKKHISSDGSKDICENKIEDLKLLIHKWRKGCQDALCELLDVTKEKIPGNENIEMGSLLKMLNLPTELVKYNSDQCCFE